MPRQEPIMSRKNLPFFLLYGVIAALAAVIPVGVWTSSSPLVGSTYSQEHQLFELFGFTASVAILLIAYVQWKREPTRTADDFLFWVVPLLVNFFFLTLIAEYSTRSWDYRCYEKAARTLLAGANPYQENCYLYPPLLAQLMSLAYRLLAWVATQVGSPVLEEDRLWFLVFYSFRVLHLVMVNLAVLLGFRFARRLGIPRRKALIVVAALLIFSNPMFRTFRHHQINLYVVNLIFLATLTMLSRPGISGLMVALGVHLKLYPLLIGIPAALVRSRRALLGVLVGVVAVVLLQTNFARDWHVWRFYLGSIPLFPSGTAFRDNSLHSVIFNSVKFGSQQVAIPAESTAAVVLAGVVVATVAMLLWFGVRFYRREQAYRVCIEQRVEADGTLDLNFLRLSGHVADTTALMLLISPMVWEHHYVIALPLAIWALAIQGTSRPWPVIIALLLMFAVPTFDFFPFSYHRLAGLILLLVVANPRQVLPVRAQPEQSLQPPV